MKTVDERLQEVGLTAQQAKEATKVFLQYLPSPVNIEEKWESGTIHVTLNGKKSHDDNMVVHIAKFGEDQGYNRYYAELMHRLSGYPTNRDKDFIIT